MGVQGTILVTGGAGYIGSVLAPQLLQAGWAVTILDSFVHRQNSLAMMCLEPNCKLVYGDVRNTELVKTLVREADVVLPLAALVGAPACDRDVTTATSLNLDAQLGILKMLAPSQSYVMPMTNSGYGVGQGSAECTEESPLRPLSLYGRHKVEVERAAMERDNSISLRLATVFGMSPRMRLDLLLNDFVYRAMRDRTVVLFEPHFRRNFIHVRDVAAAFLQCVESFASMRGNIYNVGLTEANVSKAELCRRIAKHIPAFSYFEAPVGEDPDKRDYIVSNAKLERTGWRARVSLDGGITELIKAYGMLNSGGSYINCP